MENRFRIQSNEEKKRLDVFLAERLSITRSKVKEMFDQARVRISGKVPKPSFKVRLGLVIEGEIPEEKPLSISPQDIALEILYEDEYILAINKPKGMVVHPSFGHSEGTLVNAILGYLQKSGERQWAIDNGKRDESRTRRGWGMEGASITRSSKLQTDDLSPMVRPGIVHRLDKDTTGVILVAKDPRSQEMMSGLFKERVVHKTYRTIVEGIVRKNEGSIEGSIGRHPIQRKKMAVVKKGGRESQTSYKILQRLDGFTYVEAYPRTGRTHQIRVHFAHIGHPVVGDEAYGRKAKHAAGRPLLHAYSISFTHPVKGLPMQINAPVPDDMARFLLEHKDEKSVT